MTGGFLTNKCEIELNLWQQIIVLLNSYIKDIFRVLLTRNNEAASGVPFHRSNMFSVKRMYIMI